MSIAKQNQTAFIAERLRSHKLLSQTFQQTFDQPVDVVRWFGAVQAQDFHGAKWALALRMRKATNASVEEAFNRGEIIRTHILRPTWHFVAPDDFHWLLQLTAPRVNLRSGSGYRKFELDVPLFKRSNRALTKALQGGKHLTRSELKAVLNRSGIAAEDTVRMAHILLRAELDGVVCSGPRRGNQFTYALVEERVPEGRQLSHEEALAEITRRYFMSHGPASLADFVWWSGLTTNDARLGIALLDRELEATQIGETTYWNSNSAPKSKRISNAAAIDVGAHLLPAYDEYNVAYKNRQLVLDGASGITNWDALGPTVIAGGRIVGTWSSSISKRSVEIDLQLLRTLNKREALAVSKAAERYATFLEISLVVGNT